MKKSILALALMALAVSGLAAEEPSGKGLPSSKDSEILLIGKFFCSIKRHVPLPFKGIVTSVRVQPGQMVDKGEVLAAYHLSPEARLQIHRSLASSQVKDYETKLSEVQKKIEALEAQKKRQLLLLLAQQQMAQQQMAQQQLASPLSLIQTDQEVKTLTKQKVTLLETLRHEKQVAQEELGLLRLQLGVSLNRGQLAAEAYLIAPISGYIIWVHPDLHVNAELEPTKSVLQIGVMDPMLLRSRVFESDAMQLTPGDEAEVLVPSIPGRKFKAQGSRVAWAPQNVIMDNPTHYDIEFSVVNPDLLLKEGLQCTIIMRKHSSPASPGQGITGY
jgi:multidrug efflux pump subunit AcrA (membrane-fusion protein)